MDFTCAVFVSAALESIQVLFEIVNVLTVGAYEMYMPSQRGGSVLECSAVWQGDIKIKRNQARERLLK